MSSVSPARRNWLRPGFLGFVALAFAAQLGMILWVGARNPIASAAPRSAPWLRLAGEGSTELLRLTDPTLFALPHDEGFSGSAWLSIEPQDIQPFTWSEPPRFLPLSLKQLASISPGPDDPTSRWPAPAAFSLDLMLPLLEDIQYFPTNSNLRVTGDLKKRLGTGKLKLPSWPFPDLLSNTVVELALDPDGVPFTATLLARSGLKEADDYALRLAATNRFEPLDFGPPGGGSRLAWGQLVFQWHTVPTNEVPAKP